VNKKSSSWCFAWGRHTLNIYSKCRIGRFVVSFCTQQFLHIYVYCCYHSWWIKLIIMVDFLCKHFSLRKNSLVGHAKAPVTSPLLKIIKFHAWGKLRRKHWTDVEDFMRKCQAAIGIHYFDVTVWFQCTHFLNARKSLGVQLFMFKKTL